MAKNHSKSLVSNMSGKYWEELCMTGNEMATSDCLGGWISCLQLLHAFAIPSMRLMWNRLQKKIGLMTSLRRLLITSWQRKDVWKTLLQNKSSGTINPAYLPLELLNNTKNVSINKILSITNFAHNFYPATLEEHPSDKHGLDRVLFWKTCTGKKCINVYTLDLGWYAIEGHLLEQLLRPLHAIK